MFGARLDTQTMAIYAQNTIVASPTSGYGAAISVAIFLIIGDLRRHLHDVLRVQEHELGRRAHHADRVAAPS